MAPIELGVEQVIELDTGEIVEIPLRELCLLLAPQLVTWLRPAWKEIISD